MDQPEISYPGFELEDTVEALEDILVKAIPEINLQYFDTNPRFINVEKIASLSLVDYLGIYEEGDWWALSILKAIHTNGQLK